MFKRSRPQASLKVESLENRLLMAGDVSVQVRGGNLYIEGDDQSNLVGITAGATAGEYIIAGFSTQPGTETNINGQPNGVLTVSGVRHHVFVNLKAGNDLFAATDADFRRDVTINMADGNDLVLLGQLPDDLSQLPELPLELPPIPVPTGPIRVGGSLVIRAGEGDDVIAQNAVRVRADELIDAAIGDDRLFLGAPGDTELAIDDITGDGTAVGHHLAINLGGGDDSLTGYNLRVGRSLKVLDLSGVNRVDLEGVHAGDHVVILAAQGNDTVHLHAVKSDLALVATGGAADAITIQGSDFRHLHVLLGKGADTLEIGGTTVRREGLLLGQDGIDEYADLGGNSFRRVRRRGF